jgi:hypothetical protein
VAHIATFGRVKKLSSDVAAITEALKTEPSIVFNDDFTAIKRAEPLPADDHAYNLRCLRVVRTSSSSPFSCEGATHSLNKDLSWLILAWTAER